MLVAYLAGCAFVCAWFAKALIDFGSYYSVFGKLKLWFISKYFNENDALLFNDIINDEALPAWEVSEKINSDIYWHVAKRSKKVYWLMCPYCQAVWLFCVNLYFTCCYVWPFELIYFPFYIILGVALIYFFLNFAKQS